MRIIKKTVSILKESSGESIVEVLVAFTLLSIMLVIFSQGLASAAVSEANAKNSRESADKSMINLQRILASSNPKADAQERESISVATTTDSVKSYLYTIDGNTYIVFYPG